MIKFTPNVIRRALLLVSATAMVQTASAQFRYTVKDTTTAYSALPSSATSLNGATAWFGDQFTAAIPFTWKMDSSIVMTSVPVDLSFPGILESFAATTGNGFYFASTIFVDRGYASATSMSPISYTTVGTSPNRIFKLQFDNAGFADDAALTDYVNFQFWIYETTNVIEFHYGSSSITASADYFGTGSGPLIGTFRDVDMTSFNTGTIYYLDNSMSPTGIDSVQAPFTALPLNGLTAWPSSGSVIRFTPKITCAKPLSGFTSSAVAPLSARYTFTAAVAGLDSLVWNFGDGIKQKVTTAFATPVLHSYTSAGRYDATVTAYNRCGSTTSARSQVKVAVGDVPGLASVKVYPTEVDATVTVEGLIPGARILILAQNGQIVKEVSAMQSSLIISVASLPAGAYMLQITSGGGQGVTRIFKR